MKKRWHQGLSAPAPGLYTCIWPPFSKIFLSKTAWPIKAKFHVEPPWEGVKKVCINGPSHMTTMAATAIYGKNLQKCSSPEPEGLWFWNLACSIRGSSSTKYINDDPGLTFTYFTAMSNLVAYTFEWGKVLQSHLMGKTCSKGLNWLNNCVYEKKKKKKPGGYLPLPRGYIHVYDHYFQTSSSVKPLGQSTPNFIWSLLGKGERKYI